MGIVLEIAFELEKYIRDLTAGFIVLLLVMDTSSDENCDIHNRKSHVPFLSPQARDRDLQRSARLQGGHRYGHDLGPSAERHGALR